MADDVQRSTNISDDDEEEAEDSEAELVDVHSNLMDTRDMSTYWKGAIGAMTDPPTGWPLEVYTPRDENTEFLTTRLQTVASEMDMVRVLSPNQYPYDIMFCLFVVRPVDTLRTCWDNMRGTYKETIAHLFDKLGLRSDFSRVVFTLATNTMSHCYSSSGIDQYKFVIYQINSESDIFHVELWRSLTNVPKGFSLARSLYMNWYKTMYDRTKAFALTKLVAVTERFEAITELANPRGMQQCVPMKTCDNDTNVRVTVVSPGEVSVGQHVHITCIQTPPRPKIEWAVQVLKANLENECKRQLYTHVLGRGTFGVVYGVTKNIVCKIVHDRCKANDTQRKCMESFEEAAITMELSKCDYITRLYYATLGVNTVNKRYTCYMFMERATLSLDVVFTYGDLSRHNWLKPIVEHDTLQALAYMHKHGFVHRDLKYHNMLLFIQGGHAVIKLCDLGCSQLGYSATSRSGDMYRAPPEVLIYPLYSPASDMFSWAVVMWNMYTGIIPFYQNDYSFYSITRKLFTIVGCYQNMAKYGENQENQGSNPEAREHLCGHNVCTLNSDKEFKKIAEDLYNNYHAMLVPGALTPLLVTNMSIFPQRRYTAEDLLGHSRYTEINRYLIHRTVLRREQLDCPEQMPGLLFDRESKPMRAMLVERIHNDCKVKTHWSNKHKTYYGHEHYDITESISKTKKFSVRTKNQAPRITYLTTLTADETYSQLGLWQPDDEDDMVLSNLGRPGPSNARAPEPNPVHMPSNYEYETTGDRRANVGYEDGDRTRSRSLLTSESEVDVLAQPKYFLRRGYPETPNIRDVIHKTDIVRGQPFLPWYNHYIYVIGLPELTKVSVLPVRNSDGAFIVCPFAQGSKCGVMYVTANDGDPLYNYVVEWRKSHHTIFPAAVCQLTTIMSELQKRKIIPKRPLYLGDLWWNNRTETVRLDLFNIAITNELVVNSNKPFSVWGRPLLYQLAKMCKLQELVGNTIEGTIAALQKSGYSLKLMRHNVYMFNMVAGFRPRDPMGNTPDLGVNENVCT